MKLLAAFLSLSSFVACAGAGDRDSSEDQVVGSRHSDDTAASAAENRSSLRFGPLSSNALTAVIKQDQSSLLSNRGGQVGVSYSASFGGKSLTVAATLDRGQATIESGFARLSMGHEGQHWRAKSGTLTFAFSQGVGVIELKEIILVSLSTTDSGPTLGPITGSIRGSVVSECPVGIGPSGGDVEVSRFLDDGGLQRCR